MYGGKWADVRYTDEQIKRESIGFYDTLVYEPERSYDIEHVQHKRTKQGLGFFNLLYC